MASFASGPTGWTTSGTDVTISTSFSGLGGSFPSPITHVDDGSAITPQSGNGNFAVLNGTLGDTSSVLEMTGIANPDPGETGVFSFDYNLFAHNDQGSSEFNSSNDGASLTIFAGSTAVTTINLSETYFDPSGGGASDSGWVDYSVNLGSVPSGPLSVVFTVDASHEPNGYYFGAAIDDVSLTVDPSVPDSSSTALLLGGVMSALCFVRRKLA